MHFPIVFVTVLFRLVSKGALDMVKKGKQDVLQFNENSGLTLSEADDGILQID